ncbi:hypothetical protein M758_6G170200 [Ceratodon purpureus]|nr:hypothetical protein M758_6G170200 [Ceratodon purpureus]
MIQSCCCVTLMLPSFLQRGPYPHSLPSRAVAQSSCPSIFTLRSIGSDDAGTIMEARSARVAVLVLLGSALVGLCLPHDVLPPVTGRYSQPSFKALDPSRDVESGDSKAGFHNVSPSSIRSTARRNSDGKVSVRTVALKHVDVGGGGPEDPGEDDHQKLESFESDADVVASWRESTDTRARMSMSGDGEADIVHRIGKRMMVMHRSERSLRTSKPYPCSLPVGTCQGSLTVACCGSSCADVATNRNHCGRCGHLCKSDRACCNGKCRRLATDERNCGRCGLRCARGTKCLFGLCGY